MTELRVEEVHAGQAATRAEREVLLPVYPHASFEPVRGEGVWLETRDGRRLLDFYGGHAVALLGYGHPRLLAFSLVEGRIQSGEVPGFVGVAVKAVRQNEEGRGPNTDNDAETFGMGSRLGGVPVEEPPDGDGKENGKNAGLKADRADGAADGGIHGGKMDE